MKYRTTRKADREIIDLYVRSVADFGVQQAEKYYDGLLSVFELLANNPFLARERVELNPPMRLHPYEAHVIVYTTTAQGILIVRVLHGRQDWQRLLS